MATDPEKADVSMGSGDELNETGEGVADKGAQDEPKIQMIVTLPQNHFHPAVVRRVKALKNNQLLLLNMETEFLKEVHALECKYMDMYKPLFEKRATIVNGTYEPTDEESEFATPEQDEDLVAAIEQMQLKDKPDGIPEFWANIFRNVDLLSDITEEYDYPVLNHLLDVKVDCRVEPMGFTLNFHFSPNEFFTNEVLTKTYEMACAIDKEEPFSFEGTEIVKAIGCTIDWNKGKNVTVQTIKKKQKHKQRGSIRTVCKTIDVPSFFHFFNPPTLPADGEEIDEETQLKLTNDFEVGQYIRERIVPRAVLYFTGEALDDEDDEYDEDEEEEEEEEEEEDDDEVDDRLKAKRNKVKGKGKQQAEECKQQ